MRLWQSGQALDHQWAPGKSETGQRVTDPLCALENKLIGVCPTLASSPRPPAPC